MRFRASRDFAEDDTSSRRTPQGGIEKNHDRYSRSPVMVEYPCEYHAASSQKQGGLAIKLFKGHYTRSTLLGRYPAESSEVGEHWLLRTEH